VRCFDPCNRTLKFQEFSEDSQVPTLGVWVSSSHSLKVGLRHAPYVKNIQSKCNMTCKLKTFDNIYGLNHSKILKPHASSILIVDGLKTFLSQLWSMKLPTHYRASLVKHVADKKLGSMKSHDYHMLIQQVLPLCLKGLMGVEPWMVIMRFSHVFR
jgi:hypothetical protein